MSSTYGSSSTVTSTDRMDIDCTTQDADVASEDGSTNGASRRGSRPQNLYLEITPAICGRDPLASITSSQDAVLSNIKHNSATGIIDHAVSSSRSDSSSRCSTPTPSTASSTDDSSIATPTLDTSSLTPTFPFSPTDNTTRLLLRDRYLESQRPIIVGSNNSLDIPRAVFQEPKNDSQLLDIFTPPETPASINRQERRLEEPVPLLNFQLEREGSGVSTPTDWETSDFTMGIDNRIQNENEEDQQEQSLILQPSGPYELDDAIQPTKLGSGAWSNVYKGLLKLSKIGGKQLLIAVKQPLNTFSIPALKREALILSQIQRKVNASDSYQSIIPFHGFDEATNSILMTALSGDNLEQFTTRCRISQPNTANFNSRKLPIVGITQWLFIAERLIGAFAFLKASGVIHGDVKPQNILTKAWERHGDIPGYDWISVEEAESLVEPIVSDFSSAYLVDSNGSISDDEEAINAVTTIYCAPELLAAFLTPPTTPTKAFISPSTPTSVGGSGLAPPKKVEPRPLPTFSSDQYGLCMTLLQCAIGSHPYSAAKMDLQRNMWVRQGDPMVFARADERGFRCRPSGIVDRLLKTCFGKSAEGRTEIEELERRIQALCGEWKGRNGQEAWAWGA
ncbi:hypothetical protein H072_8831 [Dactylellina haptotyla CBS 200.50]|uniref:Protein kinase domain-containing protein n=1 Tax=Dactylellina haptotyla (strain CBS 200.50) TaxID=1284197 RepID=S8BE02_DACHA|nr:hypothetical protein H072_8831 [Dactylellina haptotyla CBS 200.50]